MLPPRSPEAPAIVIINNLLIIIACLNTWTEQCNGMKEFFEGEMIADALKVGNPFVEGNLLTWLADKLPNGSYFFKAKPTRIYY